MRGVFDRNGEQFAYVEGNTLYTLEGEVTGRLEDGFVVDTAGNKMWRVVGHALYTPDGAESVGYLSEDKPD